ncbi:hypothetical protein C6345_12430 [Bacillus sp. LNXM12-2]|nr:hypothetical protein BEN31_16540 [Bacillus pumilus]PRS42300.1 hypothetical protein C6Y02_03920 [Bacillus sp. NMCC4]PRS52573.1 hypothetical protein C6Y05_04685 [Bacillus sp. LNXM10]PRS55069.1 hypothetical protein C6Y00_03420 [Bacillus sp. GBSC66]PRS59460.1 hypothetical protein C6344_13675 [Bacillus sp. GBSW19]PRS71613.1 hypothetical protein C6347_00810 [Bacillus sp. NMTD17]PRS76252.1 hypothetical protein C6Y03_04430 [Bacillus sp. LNXM65]PRS79077.1 hypothetical protein C6Y04_00815 [Bacillus
MVTLILSFVLTAKKEPCMKEKPSSLYYIMISFGYQNKKEQTFDQKAALFIKNILLPYQKAGFNGRIRLSV